MVSLSAEKLAKIRQILIIQDFTSEKLVHQRNAVDPTVQLNKITLIILIKLQKIQRNAYNHAHKDNSSVDLKILPAQAHVILKQLAVIPCSFI